MISTTREERRWFVRNLAQGLADYTGASEPPVPVEEMLKHPPEIYQNDFGVVDMYSSLWDILFFLRRRKELDIFQVRFGDIA